MPGEASGMGRFVVRRLAAAALVVLAVSLSAFAIFNVIPSGDPAERMAGRAATETQVEAVRREWGFDRSLLVQYGTMMRKLATGDLVSYATRLDVVDELARRAPRTIALAAGAALVWMLLAVGAAIYSVRRRGALGDRAVTAVSLVCLSLPVFWLGALLSHYLGFEAGLFPNGGYVRLIDDPPGWAYHLVLPWLTLGIVAAGLYVRVLRAGMLREIRRDHIRTARAKGIPERRVVSRHVLPNALVPVLPLWGLDLGAVLAGGAVLVESVFDLGGVGQYAAGAIGALDAPVVLAVTVFGAVAIVAINTAVEIAHGLLDPRARADR